MRVGAFYAALGKLYGERGWMGVVVFLRDAPHVALCVRLVCQSEVRLNNQVKHFVSGKEVARVEVDAAVALPDDDLPYGESVKDISTVLK